MQDVKGKYIWILGASSGIGAALAKELASSGAIIALSARRADKLNELRATLAGEGHIV
ncbi:MAG: SDR family NAD(P)-dependent oxidoreductase, partial [Pseudomonadota bacterium]|nr:SDR family NAD(P)-dependent oxidoreductase [Pseudomonadota bacterium]